METKKIEYPGPQNGPEKQGLREQLQESLVGELRKPDQGSYLKKLSRIMGALVLSGIATLSATKKEAISPEFQKEGLAFEHFEAGEMTEPDLATILAALRERGGLTYTKPVVESRYEPFPARKHEKLAPYARDETLNENFKRSYFSNPKNVFGEEFIKNNPEKAREWWKKIEEAMQATVYVYRNDGNNGSGVIMKRGDKYFILTNEHVVAGQDEINIEFINGFITTGYVAAKDKVRDLATIEFAPKESSQKEKKMRQEKILKTTGFKHLNIQNSEESDPGHTYATIGHPMGFPFEVSTSHLEEYVQDMSGGMEVLSIKMRPDGRFFNLACFKGSYNRTKLEKTRGGTFWKGETIPGMSGGPVINLDKKGPSKIAGIQCAYVESTRNGSPDGYFSSVIISTRTIRNFLKENGY